MPEDSDSLYNVAKAEIERLTKVYLKLVDDTQNFTKVQVESLSSREAITILLAGIGSLSDPEKITVEQAVADWERRLAVPFEIETSITAGVYLKLREVASTYYDEVADATAGFTKFEPEFIQTFPHYLPLWQHVGGIFSKSVLKKLIGSVSDTKISLKAAVRLASELSKRVDPKTVEKARILAHMGGTLEGMVRDLVGKILLESVVASAFEVAGIQFQREKDYDKLSGVVYDFRADFVVPNAKQPKVFIEVRKSSSRHASLYAKDKMFSAINWKGNHKDLLGVLVIDGNWTTKTIDVMGRVFDYVLPVRMSAKAAEIVSAYMAGDQSKLKWLIDFQVIKNQPK
jgi:hypothetical protein